MLIGLVKITYSYMAAFSLIDKISSGLDDKLTTVDIFIDLTKSFDTIDHYSLHKSYMPMTFGICHIEINRQQYVEFDDCDSGIVFNTTWCVARFNTSTIALYTLYIWYKQMYQKIKLHTVCTWYYRRLSNGNLTDTLHDVANEYHAMSDLLKTNKLSFSIMKTKWMIFDNKIGDKKDINVFLDWQRMDASHYTIFHVRTIDDKLICVKHIDSIRDIIFKVKAL